MVARLGLLLVASLALLVGCGSRAGETVGQIPWRLAAVSVDARTLEIWHEIPHCATEPGKLVVREDARSVRISLPEVRSEPTGDGCTLDQRFGSDSVRLAAPLGRRTLSQPGRKPGSGTRVERRADLPGAQECARLVGIAADAPARDVPWVARRIDRCEAPIPAAARRLPIEQRAQTRADRLPTALQVAVHEADLLLRPEAVRRLQSGGDLYFVPGPRSACLGRLVQGRGRLTDCEPTDRVGRRGVYAALDCASSTPKTVSLVGIVPAGVERVRLEPRRGTARAERVIGGVWAAADLPYPLEISYHDVRFKMTYEKRACFS